MVPIYRRGPARATALILALLMIAVVALPSAAFATDSPAPQPQADAAHAAATWLLTQQQPDGGFAAFGGASDPGATADVVQALAAAGVDPRTVATPGGADALTYLENAVTSTLDSGKLAKVVLALHAANAEQPADAAGSLNAAYDAATSRYGQSFYGSLLTMLALHVLGQDIPAEAVTAVLDAQTPEGSWGFNGDPTAGTGDSNTTAIAVQVLAAIGADAEAQANGLAYLATLRDENGAIGYDAAMVESGGGDANSTALALQAFLTAPDGEDDAIVGELLAALLGFQNASGAFQFQPAYPDDSLLATVQAIPALLLVPFPIPPMELAPANPALELAIQPTTARDGCQYYAITQHNVCAPFAAYWESHGGLANFGYPLSEAYDDNGMMVQYFERARFEHHPENAGTPYEVLLTRLGAEEVLEVPASHTATNTQDASCTYYAVTAHNVCGNFSTFWNTYGGLDVFGYPLTDAFEVNGVMVQYFERARMEYQPGIWPDRMDILLGRIGAETLEHELAQ